MHIVNICIQKDYIKTYKYLKIISNLKLKKNANIEFLNTEQVGSIIRKLLFPIQL